MHGRLSPFARTLALLLTLHAVLVLSLLPTLTLWNIDEGRIAQVSREMALSGDFVTPRMGEIPFAAYPPLPYWLMAASGSLFGWNEFAMRLPGALSGIALVALVALLTRRLAGEKAGLAAAMVLATIPGFFIQESMCRADVMTMLLATFALDRFLAWAEAAEEDRRRRDLALMYVSVSLGVLAKGPIAIAILGVGGLAWFLLRKKWSLLLKMGFPWGIPLAAAIVVPWYLLVYRAAGAGFLRENLLLENLNAFTQGYQQERPPTFYLGAIPAVTMPWLLALGLSWRARKARGLGLSLAWLAGVFLFLTLSSAKRQSYVTYIDPPLAMAAGITIAALWDEAPHLVRRSLLGVGGLFLAGAGVLGLVPPSRWKAERMQMIVDLLPLLAALTAAAGAVLLLVTWKRGPLQGTVTLAGVLAGAFLLYRTAIETRFEHAGRDGKAFCLRAREKVPAGQRLAILGPEEYDGAFHFYYGTPMPKRWGEPGYYLLIARARDRLLAAGKKVREIDVVLDDRKRPTYLAQVTE